MVPMVLCLMSLVGIPPLAGFIGKWWILIALGSLSEANVVQGGASLSTLGWILVVVAVLNTLISLYYYMRVVVQMTLHDDEQPAVRAPVGGLALVNVCAVMLLLLFFLVHPLKTTADRFSQDVFRTAAVFPPETSSVASIAPVVQAGD
jgi:NADH-quinone oxidoreductase subunit N